MVFSLKLDKNECKDNDSNIYLFIFLFFLFTVADPGFGQGGGQEFFSEILPT